MNAGKYIKIENNKFEIKTYYELDNTPNYNQTEDEIIDNINELFRNAVKLEFEKDKEYRYKHIVALSGGLDSRMTTWVAHDMGYTDQLNYTFSQSDYLDEKIAKEIARDLEHEWIFKFLDNGVFLKNIEEMIKINFGNCLYSGNAHGKSFIDLINLKKFGIVHSGQLGDVIIGTYSNSKNYRKSYSLKSGAYSSSLISRINQNVINEKYSNEEIFKFYNRGLTGILQGNLPIQEYTETISPFLDIDFLNYCLKIPLKCRYGHKIYYKWIFSYFFC